jgi:hypothetical protein
MDIESPSTTKESVQQAKRKLFHIGLFCLAVIGLIPLDPFILYLLWNWFAVREGFHSLSYGYAFGLFLLLRFIISPGPPVKLYHETKGSGKNWIDNPREVLGIMAKAYLGRLYTVGAGLVIHLFLLRG